MQAIPPSEAQLLLVPAASHCAECPNRYQIEPYQTLPCRSSPNQLPTEQLPLNTPCMTLSCCAPLFRQAINGKMHRCPQHLKEDNRLARRRSMHDPLSGSQSHTPPTDVMKAMEGYLRTLDRYHQTIRYRGLPSFLLSMGIWFQGRASSNDYAICKQWKKKKQPKIQDCYYNAHSFCIQHDEVARYFEGYAQTAPGLSPAEHAWIVMVDGEVVDFTFEALEREAKRRKIAHDTRDALYVGLEVPLDIVTISILKNHAYGPVAEEFFQSQESGRQMNQRKGRRRRRKCRSNHFRETDTGNRTSAGLRPVHTRTSGASRNGVDPVSLLRVVYRPIRSPV